MPNGNYMTYDPELQRLQRQQRYAELLQQQANEPIPIESGGGAQAPISPFSLLAKALQAYGGRKMLEQGDAQYADLQAKRQQQLAESLQNFGKSYKTVDTQAAQAQEPGGEPLQQYAMAEPSDNQKMAEALRIASIGTNGADAAGSALFKNVIEDVDLKKKQAMLVAALGGGQPTEPPQNSPMPTGTPPMPGPVPPGPQGILGGMKPPPGVSESAWRLAMLTGDPGKAATLAQSGMPARMNPVQQAQYDDFVKSGLSWQDYSARGKAAEYEATVPARIRVAGASAAARQDGQVGPQTPITLDPTSNNLSSQTGLSSGALDFMFGRATTKAANVLKGWNKEITDWGIKNNIDTSTLRYQAPAIGKVLDQNIVRNNQANILEGEIEGSVSTLAPILDAVGRGKIAVVNKGGQWVARNLNDDNAIQAADQINRLISEVAGYNSIAGGKLNEQGGPKPGPEEYHDAAAVINTGISGGGAQSVLKSISKSAAKNRVVLLKSIDDAKRQQWEMLGLGKRFKSSIPAPPAGASPTATEADIQHTMQVRKMTRQQVIDKLKERGISVAP